MIIFTPIFRPDIVTLDVVLHLALIQLINQIGFVRASPLLFQGVKHHATQFLNVVLLPR